MAIGKTPDRPSNDRNARTRWFAQVYKSIVDECLNETGGDRQAANRLASERIRNDPDLMARIRADLQQSTLEDLEKAFTDEDRRLLSQMNAMEAVLLGLRRDINQSMVRLITVTRRRYPGDDHVRDAVKALMDDEEFRAAAVKYVESTKRLKAIEGPRPGGNESTDER